MQKNLAKRIKAKKSDIGILVCGSGTGMAISANKTKGIRAAVCYNLSLLDCLDNTIMLI